MTRKFSKGNNPLILKYPKLFSSGNYFTRESKIDIRITLLFNLLKVRSFLVKNFVRHAFHSFY